jgi:uncharacterized protein with GYD domain
MKSVGGSLDGLYFSFGENDFHAIGDLPDHASSSAISFVGNASGTFRIKTVVLVSPEEVDEAAKKSVEFRPPGH